jgi:hypothetical protein
VKLLPLPAAHWVPPSVLYSQAAPASSPLTTTCPLVLMPSLGLLPLSTASARVGVGGGVVSAVTAWSTVSCSWVTSTCCVRVDSASRSVGRPVVWPAASWLPTVPCTTDCTTTAVLSDANRSAVLVAAAAASVAEAMAWLAVASTDEAADTAAACRAASSDAAMAASAAALPSTVDSVPALVRSTTVPGVPIWLTRAASTASPAAWPTPACRWRPRLAARPHR